jgi:type II secretory pathway predicted ATPase ExeA
VPTPATDEVLPSLERCAREGGGIGILSAPAGTGKTAVALEVGRRIAEQLHVVYLSSSNYTSRRGLLQAILFELGVDYTGLSEQEARLRVIEFARSLMPERDGLVLLVDEADQLSERLLEELRALANYIHEGHPLLRLVLCGQLGLDERLASPELDAFNQRVGCHVVLETLDRKQSAQYIRATLATCGSRVEEVFSAEALDLICVASDGNIRCLHQLCDHALLLAFVAEERPVSMETVRGALEDLQGLPLNWNVPASARRELTDDLESESDDTPVDVDHDDDRSHSMTPPADSGSDPVAAPSPQSVADEAPLTVIEFGGESPKEAPAASSSAASADFEPAMGDDVVCVEPHPSATSREYQLHDRYAELDRLAELNQSQTPVPEAVPVLELSDSAEDGSADSAAESAIEISLPDSSAHLELEGELLAEIGEMRDEVRHVSSYDAAIDEPNTTVSENSPRPGLSDDEAEWDVIQPEPENEQQAAVVETGGENQQPPAGEPTEFSPTESDPEPWFTSIPVRDSIPTDDAIENVERFQRRHEPGESEEGRRRYAFLFTRLRDRRRELAARSEDQPR